MKQTLFIKSLVLFIILSCTVVIGYSQTVSPTATNKPNAEDGDAERNPDNRQNLLRQLNLSREQIQLIRRNNIARRPLMMACQTRLRQANRMLDDAIYADLIDEATISARTQEAQFAQSELIRLRSEGELINRKVLTPEQLKIFRELRKRFEVRRDKIEKAMQDRKVINERSNGSYSQSK